MLGVFAALLPNVHVSNNEVLNGFICLGVLIDRVIICFIYAI
jgi:hypothetical protein